MSKPKLRMFGLFNGKGFKCCYTAEEFLNEALRSCYSTAWFFAHWGGTSDILFLIKPLLNDPRYQVTAKMAGSSANIVKIRKGSLYWVFVDSAWLMRVSLDLYQKVTAAERLGESNG